MNDSKPQKQDEATSAASGLNAGLGCGLWKIVAGQGYAARTQYWNIRRRNEGVRGGYEYLLTATGISNRRFLSEDKARAFADGINKVPNVHSASSRNWIDQPE